MILRHKFFAAVMVALTAVSSASAATITYSLKDNGNPGTFKLTATTSAGDNFGLSFYAVTVNGASTILHNNVTPRGSESDSGTTFGFSFARSADGVAVVSAAQDTTGGGMPVYGMGQVAGSIKTACQTAFPAGTCGGFRPAPNGDYAAEVVLATGTYAASAPPVLGTAVGNVWTSSSTNAFAPGTVVLSQFPSGGVAPVGIDAVIGPTANVHITHQFQTSAGDPPITWSALTKVSGPAQAINPSLSNSGFFDWDNNTSPRPGTYVWKATATNQFGSDNDVQLSINLIVPEPATLSLLGLAMVGLVGFGARKRS